MKDERRVKTAIVNGNPGWLTLPRTQAEARRKGVVRYYTGIPCSHGHHSYRWTEDARCGRCKNEPSLADRRIFALFEAAARLTKETRSWHVVTQGMTVVDRRVALDAAADVVDAAYAYAARKSLAGLVSVPRWDARKGVFHVG